MRLVTGRTNYGANTLPFAKEQQAACFYMGTVFFALTANTTDSSAQANGRKLFERCASSAHDVVRLALDGRLAATLEDCGAGLAAVVENTLAAITTYVWNELYAAKITLEAATNSKLDKAAASFIEKLDGMSMSALIAAMTRVPGVGPTYAGKYVHYVFCKHDLILAAIDRHAVTGLRQLLFKVRQFRIFENRKT
jgi:endonuclease III